MLLTGKTYRLEDESIVRLICEEKESVFTVCLRNKDYETPVIWNKENFKQFLRDGVIQEVEDPIRMEDFKEPTKKMERVRDERYRILLKYWNDPTSRMKLLSTNSHKEIYEKIANEMSVSFKSARRVMTRFWRNGMVPNALLPRDGQHKKEERKKENRTGKKAEMEENFRKAYEKYYLKRNSKLTLRKTYENMILDSYTTESEGKAQLTGEVPSFRQFYYWVQNNRDYDEENRKRKGERNYNSNDRLLKDKTISQAPGPGRRFEIDATHLNIQLVSERDPKIVIGKPLLFSVIDVYSKMIVGFSLSFENESWQSAAQAIVNTVQDKTEFCRAHGIEIEDWEWPSRYLPGILLSDNGAFKSKNAEVLTSCYGVTLEYASPWRGDLKGNIERSHERYKQLIAATLPGSSTKDGWQRGEKDPKETAQLTLEDLRKIIILLTLNFNKKIMEDYPLSPEMIADGVVANPVGLWNWGLEQGRANLKVVSDPMELKLRLLPVEERVIRQDGIHLHDMIYTGADSKALNYLQKHQKQKVKVHYDPDDITKVYLGDEDLIELVLSNAYKSYVGLSLFETRRFLEIKRLQASGSQAAILEDSFSNEQAINEILRNAKKRNDRRDERIYEKLKQERTVREPKQDVPEKRDDGFDRMRREFIQEKKNQK